MKAKTIRQVLRKKINEWLETIEDVDLRSQLEKKVIVTGGCIASMLLKEPVSDYDVYLRDRDICVKLANYYVDRFKPAARNGIDCIIYVDTSVDDRVRVVVKSAGVASERGSKTPYEYFEARPDNDPAAGAYIAEVLGEPGDIEDTYTETEKAALETIDEGKPQYRPVFISTNAITLSNRLQIITRFYGDPEEIHANYDFAHCTNFWKSWDDELVLRPAALEALLTKELKYVGSKYPICSLIRVRKFVSRGWQINAGQILKMVMQTSELDLKNVSVLQDQLTGVDAAYFFDVMRKVKEHDPDKVSSAYLCEILDRLF